MAEYIKRGAALNCVFDLIETRLEWKSDARGEIQGLNAAYCAIEDISTADVRPVAHGEWEFEYENIDEQIEYCCSVCDWIGVNANEYNYCPNCGADMREAPNDP